MIKTLINPTKHEYLKNVTTLKLDMEKCIGCKMCTIVCPHGVFKITDKKAIIVEKDLCIECGACAQNCSVEALSVTPGVGCAAAFIQGWLTGTEPSCDCKGGSGGKTKSECC